MDPQTDEAFLQRMIDTADLFAKAITLAGEAVEADLFRDKELNEAIQRFVTLRELIMRWPTTDIQSRYQSSFITLINDAILVFEATRDGGNDIAASHDMQEAANAVYVEYYRLIDRLRANNPPTA